MDLNEICCQGVLHKRKDGSACCGKEAYSIYIGEYCKNNQVQNKYQKPKHEFKSKSTPYTMTVLSKIILERFKNKYF